MVGQILNTFKKAVAAAFSAFVLVVLGLASCASSTSPERSAWTNFREVKTENHGDTDPYKYLVTAAFHEVLAERYDVAYVLLLQALAVRPDAPEALYEMAMIALQYGSEEGPVRISDGDSLLRRAVALAPDNDEYLQTLGSSLIQKEDYAEAVSVYEKIVARKETEAGLRTLSRLYRMTGQGDKALRTLDRWEQLEGLEDEISYERYLVLLDRQDTVQAFAAIDALCQAHPGEMYYQAFKANLYHQQGKNDKALALFQEVLQKEPQQVYARVSLLDFYRTMKEEDAARQLFEGLVCDPELEEEVRGQLIRQFYMEALQEKKDTATVLPLVRRVLAVSQEDSRLASLTCGYLEALNLPLERRAFAYRRVLEIAPEDVAARGRLLQLAVEKEQPEQIHALSVEGRKYAPGEVAFYIYDAFALSQMEREEEAIRVLETAEEKMDSTTEGEVRSQMLALLGDLRHARGEKEKAYAAYDKAIAYDKNNLLCLNNYAYFLSQEGIDLDRAAAMSKQTVEAEPSNPTYLDTYAWILYMQENYTQAKIYIDETMKHAEAVPENVTLYDHAGDIYYRCGQPKEALAYWKQALQLAEDPVMRKALQRKIKAGKLPALVSKP